MKVYIMSSTLLPENCLRVDGYKLTGIFPPDIHTQYDVVLPDTIQSIRDGCHYSKAIRSIVMPNVVIIHDGAFGRCLGLERIQFSDTLKTIGAYAFHKTAIKEVHIPASCISIEQDAFGKCNNLQAIVFDGADLHMHEQAFRLCNRVKHIKFPNYVVDLEKYDANSFSEDLIASIRMIDRSDYDADYVNYISDEIKIPFVLGYYNATGNEFAELHIADHLDEFMEYTSKYSLHADYAMLLRLKKDYNMYDVAEEMITL